MALAHGDQGMDVISISAYAKFDGDLYCPFCGEACGDRGFCETCLGCFLCCWSHVHCFSCDLPEILCECVSCEDEEGEEGH
jgi:hypothetical protein